MIFIVTMIVVFAGAFVFARGWRGTLVDDHPYCRSCGYHLGEPDRHERCPECGTTLTARTIRIGMRERRRVPMTAGALLMVIGIAGTLVTIGIRLQGANLNTYKPVWWLMIDADNQNPGTAQAAVTELESRMTSAAIGPETIRDIVSDWLPDHGDPAATWIDEKSTFIERAIAAGHLAEETRNTYYQQALNLGLTVIARPTIRAQSPLSVKFIAPCTRVAPYDPGLATSIPQVTQSVGEVRNGDDVLIDRLGLTITGELFKSPSSMQVTLPLELPPGTYSLDVELKRRLLPAGAPDDSEPWTAWSVTKTIELEIVDPDLFQVEEVASVPAEEIRECITVNLDSDHVVIRKGNSSHSWSDAGHFGFVHAAEPPIDLAFEVFGELDGERTPLHSFHATAGSSHGSWFYPSIREVYPEADSIDVILVSSPAAAEKSPSITLIWAGELRFEDVPLPPPAE